MVHIDDSWYTRPDNVPDRTGAGGIVYRIQDGQLLIALVKERVFGDDQFVIPKGGVEDNENLREAAQREIAEETGLTDLSYQSKLGELGRSNFLKTWWQVSHYFIYRTEQINGIATDPDNYGLTWFPPDALPPMVWPDEIQLIASKDWSELST